MLLQITYTEQSPADYGHICILKNKMRICAQLKAGGQTSRDIPVLWFEIFKITLEVPSLLSVKPVLLSLQTPTKLLA